MSATPAPSGAPGILGHEGARTTLRRLYRDGDGPHTLALCGPEGVGRRPVGRWLAALLNCRAERPAERPCGRCEACRRHARGEDPDLREVGPAETTRSGRSRRRLELTIDQLVPRPQGDPDPLAPWLARRPVGRRRVALIDHAETLNAAAANAFLKVLEEPPPWAVVVLVAPGPDALLPTVASRCVCVRLGAVDTAAFADLAPHPALRLGQPGPLLEARRDPEATAALRSAVDAFVAALDGPLSDAMEAARALAAVSEDGAADPPTGWLREPWRDGPPAAYAAALDAIERCEAALAAYVNPTLAFTVLALELRGRS